MSDRFFSYSPIEGFETHPSEDAAKAAAQDAIDFYMDECDPEWSEDAEQVFYGRVSGRSKRIVLDQAPRDGCDEHWDYALEEPS